MNYTRCLPGALLVALTLGAPALSAQAARPQPPSSAESRRDRHFMQRQQWRMEHGDNRMERGGGWMEHRGGRIERGQIWRMHRHHGRLEPRGPRMRHYRWAIQHRRFHQHRHHTHHRYHSRGRHSGDI